MVRVEMCVLTYGRGRSLSHHGKNELSKFSTHFSTKSSRSCTTFSGFWHELFGVFYGGSQNIRRVWNEPYLGIGDVCSSMPWIIDPLRSGSSDIACRARTRHKKSKKRKSQISFESELTHSLGTILRFRIGSCGGQTAVDQPHENASGA